MYIVCLTNEYMKEHYMYLNCRERYDDMILVPNQLSYQASLEQVML